MPPNDRITKTLLHIASALEQVRAELAENGDEDTLLRQNEITLECLQKDWKKRFDNALELQRREQEQAA